ncbi:MAG TPA: hypothetical protein DCP92_03725, partial [Nitrospiraceae bacterium]|nr:hypothetical protein [Nitrospiraceae bacterium]
MKTCAFTDIICRGFCHFYREDRAELACGSYNLLSEILTRRELQSTIRGILRAPDFSCDEEVKALICENCDFLIDGC